VKVGVASGVGVSIGVEVSTGVGVSGMVVSAGKTWGVDVEQADCISMMIITKPEFRIFFTVCGLILISLNLLKRIQRHPYMNLTNKFYM